MRVNEMSAKVESLGENIAVLVDRNAQAERDTAELMNDIKEIRRELTELLLMSNRWRGGFIALAVLGGVLGWLLSSWESLLSIFRVR